MAIKTTFKGANSTPLKNAMASRVAGRPTSKSIVRAHKAATIKTLGYTNFSFGRPNKVSISGGQK